MLLNCGVEEDSWMVPWTARSANQSILKEISPEYSLKGLILRLKLQYFGHLMRRTAAAAAKSLQSYPTLWDPIDGRPPGSPSLGFSRQEHWSGLPFSYPMHESEK